MTTSPSTRSEPVAPAVPWARQPAVPEQRATARTRRIADGLPGWEPLPPGEILVQRPRGQ
ncbi:hypothetical protein ACQEVC_39085 [Plantactinospora sp. CA-294935]|uniref:hypothetical protein n=1 Tax=Plantactinospora sp. CA-294935 TaxID=3240012 RepID=UPI003D94B3A5